MRPNNRTRGIFYLFTRSTMPFGLGVHSHISLPNIDEYDADNPFTYRGPQNRKIIQRVDYNTSFSSNVVKIAARKSLIIRKPSTVDLPFSSIILSKVLGTRITDYGNKSQISHFPISRSKYKPT